ncbi:MAG TPA: class I SAM-dependent methyltransferase [Candidatus Lustribacter sp.]|jgi:hypothetical protein|nr:class I SAM-dependent methyltransferase [Candidatus Lustribacter sp.]
MRSEEPARERSIEDQITMLVRYIGVVYNVVLNRDPDAAEIQRHGNEMLRGLSAIEFFNNIAFSEERRSLPNLYVVPGHFYSPIVNPAELHHYLRALANIGPEIAGVSIDRDAMIALWERLLPFLTTCPFSDAPAPGYRYGYDNQAFGYGDAVVLQAMLRHRRPKRLIEIGSGHSSACTLDTVDQFMDGACEVTLIEPHPKRVRALLGDRAGGVRIIESAVQRVPEAVFAELEAGDVLFIDSTHVLRTGSDVFYELFEILPRIASGVAVHFHDMFWPFEYPSNWILEDNRSWNELYAVRAFLTNNDLWKIIFFSDYLTKIEHERVERDLPRFAQSSGSSLWLERS